MIKKITNWTFGSIFRTIGRFLAYLIIGIIIALLFVKKDYVKADTYVKGVDSPWKNNSGTLLPKNGPYHYDTKTSGSSGGANQSYQVSEFYLQSNEQVDITSIKGGTVEIPFYISATVITSNANEQWVCPTWVYTNNAYSCSGFVAYNSGTIIASPQINMWAMVVYNNGYTDMCTLDTYNNKIKCPIAQLPNNNKIWFIQIRTQVYYGDNYPSQYYFVGLGDKVNLFKNDFVSLEEQQQNQTQTIIESQENQTQQQIQSQMVCEKIDKNKVKNKNVYLDGSNGNEGNTTYNYGVTDYIRINNTDKIRIIETVTSSTPRVCFYNINKTYISCIKTNEITNYVTIPNNASYIKMTINYETDRPQFEICQNGNQAISNSINGDVSGTGENGTVTDEDAMNNSCGLLCKLKHLIKMFSLENIKYIVVPTEEQMNDLFDQMQNKITSKLGILGLPVTVYTRLMQIAMQYDDSQQNNWCLQWQDVKVPNFEEYSIIQGGQWCFSDILANEKINTFRTVCMSIIGGLILLSFIQYLFNCLHRILDVPIHDDYTYFTTEDVYNINTDTGEVIGHQIKSRQTRRER